jgi:hypothetical protein
MRHLVTLRRFRLPELSARVKLVGVLCACLLLFASASAFGQSGRKQKKTDPQPPVQGINQPEKAVAPAPETEAQPEKPKEDAPVILVATDLPDMSISLVFADIAREGCLRELRQVRTLNIKEARNQNRSDAIKAAKNDDRTTVVWMELRIDSMNASSGGFDLRYTIFEPKTGKVIGTGSGYPAQPDRLPVPPIGATRAEVMVEWAGRDVGRQVLKKLNLREL